MRFSILATALATFSAVSARIEGIAAPATIAPGSTFTLTLTTAGYIQSVDDIAVAWGFSAPGYPRELGPLTASAYLGPDKSNTNENITLQATAPKDLDTWTTSDGVVLTAGVYSLYGQSKGVTVTGFNVTVNVGEKTSEEVVTSKTQAWIVNTGDY